MCVNPIIDYLESINIKGFSTSDRNIINLPYADDFCVITSNKTTHQKILDDINGKVKSIGIKIKSSECRSLSISSGSPKIEHFKVDDNIIPSIGEEGQEQKYLGRLLFFKSGGKLTFELLKEKLSEKMTNLNSTAVRNEFKLQIYKMYILPALRFLFTVYEVADSNLEKLDTFANQQLKQWAGLPRCATTAILHSPTGMDIPSVRLLYREAHAVQHAGTRLKGDAVMQQTLDSKIVREKQLERETITVQAEELYVEAMQINAALGQAPVDLHQFELVDIGALEVPEGAEVSPTFINRVKESVKSAVRHEETMTIYEKCKTLIQQGKFLELTLQEKCDATWKLFMFNLPKGTLKFLLNSATDNLPTLTNLKTWGKRVVDKCRLCISPTYSQCALLDHVLSLCNTSLEDGRYTWRHNSVLSWIYSCLDCDKYEVYVDLPELNTAGSTMPADILVTTFIPDLILIDRQRRTLNVWELTIPAETRIVAAHKRRWRKTSTSPVTSPTSR